MTMTTTTTSAVAVHGPEGSMWLSKGEVVPEELIGLINSALLSDSGTLPADDPAGEAETTTETQTQAGDEDGSHTAPADDPAGEAETTTEVPYANYPTEKWAEYAHSLGMSVEGMKRAGIIHAVGEHFGIDSEGMNPAEVVAAIREKQ